MCTSDCENILNLITPYIDNRLSSEEIDLVEKHINSCEHCKNELYFMTSFTKKLHELPEISVTQDFQENLIEKAKETIKRKKAKRISYLKRGSMGVAAAAVVAFSVVGYSNLKPQEEIADIKQAESILSPSLKIEEPQSDKKETHQKNISPHKKTEENVESPSKSNIGVFDKTEEEIKEPVASAISLDSETEQFTKSIITVNEENINKVLELLSAYEKDDIGYKVLKPQELAARLLELGCTIETSPDEDLDRNYFIIK